MILFATLLALVGLASAQLNVYRGKVFEVAFLSAQNIRLYYNDADKPEIWLTCVDDANNTVSQQTYYFPEIQNSDVRKPWTQTIGPTDQAGNYFRASNDPNVDRNTPNVMFADDPEGTEILEAPWTFTPGTSVVCQPGNTLWVTHKDRSVEYDYGQGLDDEARNFPQDDWACLEQDEFFVMFEIPSGQGTFAGYDTCFNNRKYGMPKDWGTAGASLQEIDILEQPFTQWKNCYNVHLDRVPYTGGPAVADRVDGNRFDDCYDMNLEVRIKVMDAPPTNPGDGQQPWPNPTDQTGNTPIKWPIR